MREERGKRAKNFRAARISFLLSGFPDFAPGLPEFVFFYPGIFLSEAATSPDKLNEGMAVLAVVEGDPGVNPAPAAVDIRRGNARTGV